MTKPELLAVANDCQRLARMLGNRQSSPSTAIQGFFAKIGAWFHRRMSGRVYSYVLPADTTTRLVNALLDAGNRLEVIAKEGYTPKE